MPNNTTFSQLSIPHNIYLVSCIIVTLSPVTVLGNALVALVIWLVRLHKQQVRTNAPSENFCRPAINLEKYRKCVLTILYILSLFYFRFLPFIISLGLLIHVDFRSAKKPWHLNVCFFYATVLVFLSKPMSPHLKNECTVFLLEQPMKFSMKKLMFKQRKEIINLELISFDAGRPSA